MVAGIDIIAARGRLRPRLAPTPLLDTAWLSEMTGGRALLKLESVNVTRSFKIRGALNALTRLGERAEVAGPAPVIVTASAGNHGRAMAQAARWLGLPLHVFTPSTAPRAKTAAIRRLGATLHDEAPTYDEAERLARSFAAAHDAVFISPYNHPDVIAGAGTIGLELVEACPDLGTVVIPLGGGGLASGVAVALRTAAPRARVVAIETEASTPFTTALAHGRITPITVGPTLADGLAGNLEDGAMTFELVRDLVDEVATVSEADLVAAMGALAVEEQLVVEGSAAVGVAAVMAGLIRPAPGPLAVLVTGANIDFDTWRRVVHA